jgi:hypothetical protein
MVAGQGLIGVALAGVTALIAWIWNDPWWFSQVDSQEVRVLPVHLAPWMWQSFGALPQYWGLSEAWWKALPLFPFVLLVAWLWKCARTRPQVSLPPGGTGIAGPSEPPPTLEPPSPPPFLRGRSDERARAVARLQPESKEPESPLPDEGTSAEDTPMVVDEDIDNATPDAPPAPDAGSEYKNPEESS